MKWAKLPSVSTCSRTLGQHGFNLGFVYVDQAQGQDKLVLPMAVPCWCNPDGKLVPGRRQLFQPGYLPG